MTWNIGTQFSFVKDKGTKNAIFFLRIERTIELQKTIYLCFVDYEKSLDRMDHDKLIEILHELNIDGKYIIFIKNCYWKLKAAVNVSGDLTKYQAIQKNVRQSVCCGFGSFIISEMLIRNIEHLKGIVIGKNINNIRYLDDIVLITDSEMEFRQLVDKLTQGNHSKCIKY